MNYKKIYDKLIDRARTRILEGYDEKHHILPRCMGGTNDPANLVALTPEEHYIAHLLLIKIYPEKNGLWYAVKLMSGQGNNKSYGWIRRKLSEIGFTEKHKKNMSASQKKKWENIPRKAYVKKGRPRHYKKQPPNPNLLAERIEQVKIKYENLRKAEESEQNMFLLAHLYVI